MKSARKTEPEHSGRKSGKHDERHPEDAPSPEASASDPAAAGAASPEPSAPSAPEAPVVPPADDRLLRLQADFDNYRKRVLREKEDLYRRANEDIMEDLLPVLDHLEMALAAVGGSGQYDSITRGFKLVGEQLMAVLVKYGVVPIPAEGVAFDPNVHEAVLQMPSADVPENGIISRTRAGFMLGGRLLRAAQVVVSSGLPAAADETVAE